MATIEVFTQPRIAEHLVPERLTSTPLCLYNYQKVEDVSSDPYVSTFMQLHTEIKKSSYWRDQNLMFSIVGGYCRNHMLGIKTNTDIDMMTNDIDHMTEVLKNKFPRIETEISVPTFQLPDNTLHLLSSYLVIETLPDVVLVEPRSFDFTVNLGAISMKDGFLYAPPATIFDVKHRILRHCMQPVDGSPIICPLNLSAMLRSIRFSVKFDMRIHEQTLRAMDVLFNLMRKMNTGDDKTIYHTIKHIVEDSPEVQAKFYDTIRGMNFLDTEHYETFQDYFKYISDKFHGSPRQSPVRIATNNPY